MVRSLGWNTRLAAICWSSILVLSGWLTRNSPAQELKQPELHVPATEDFAVTGDGSNSSWNQAPWTALEARPGSPRADSTRVKVLYSPRGLYVLMDAADRVLTARIQEDFQDLWTEDVFEFFLWTDQRWPIYFEYEISPLGRELPILIPNFEGQFLGWRPWHYEGDRQTQRRVSVEGGEARSGAKIRRWTAEVFVPYDLLKPLQQVPPHRGTHWRANFYRVDYDDSQQAAWDWARVGESFHDYEKFGTLIFD